MDEYSRKVLGEKKYASSSDRSNDREVKCSIGSFGMERLEYLYKNYPDIVDELNANNSLETYLINYDQKACILAAKLEKVLKANSSILNRMDMYDTDQIIAEISDIRKNALMIIKREFINK